MLHHILHSARYALHHKLFHVSIASLIPQAFTLFLAIHPSIQSSSNPTTDNPPPISPSTSAPSYRLHGAIVTTLVVAIQAIESIVDILQVQNLPTFATDDVVERVAGCESVLAGRNRG